MTDKQPDALRLADELDGLPANDFYEALGDEAAAELRRLHAENEALRLAAISLRACGIAETDSALLQVDFAIARAEGKQ